VALAQMLVVVLAHRVVVAALAQLVVTHQVQHQVLVAQAHLLTQLGD
jgi:hypothetical protein